MAILHKNFRLTQYVLFPNIFSKNINIFMFRLFDYDKNEINIKTIH